jgi:hypothetical protein
VTLADLLAELVRGLDAAGIPHMVAGSVASTLHGEPRTTQDIDMVIDPTAPALERLVAGFDSSRFYVGDWAAALDRRDQFNVIDTRTGAKVDLIVRKDRPFSRSEFERRRRVVIMGVATAVATVEDTILAKLEWARGGSDRQRRDVVGMLAAQADTLDREYLARWAPELGVEQELALAMETAAEEIGADG